MDALKSKGQMYDQIDLGKIQKSGFDLSFDCKGTGSLGRLYPVRCMETLPGDRFQGSTQISAQFNPLAVPMLSNMFMKNESFYVPNRILWDKWEKFISGGQNLDDTSTPPTVRYSDLFDSVFKTLVDMLDSSDNSVDWVDCKQGYILVAQGNDFSIDYDFDYDEKIMSTDGNTPYYFKRVTCYKIETIVNRFNEIRDSYITFATSNGIYDLMLDSLAALDSLISYLSTLKVSGTIYHSMPPSISGLGALPVLEGYYPMFDVLNHFTAKSVISGAPLGSEYMDSIRPLLAAHLEESNLNLYLFSEYHAQILQYLYDFMRPFIGLGSNLDMLGYSCITMVDLYACVYYQLLYNSHSSSPGYWCYTENEYYLFPGFTFNDFDFFVGLPLRALYSIWYNYYRDQVLESDALEPVTSDVITNSELVQLLAPRRRCWAKDTFTTALDNTGTGSVIVPVSDSIRSHSSVIKSFDSLTAHTSDSKTAKLEDIDLVSYTLTSGESVTLPSRYINQISTGVDTSKSTGGFSLDVMKRAERVQKWIQKALIYGNRPQDFLFTHFGVRSSDARLQLPEFLSSDSQICRLDTLINNTTTAESVAGDKAANAYGYSDGSIINRFCEEHGFIITLFSIMPDTDYGFGSSRSIRRLNKFDYAFPEFATLGMDGVMNYEMCYSPVKIDDPDGKYSKPSQSIVFGYQGRYYDYKSKQNEIHGDLRDTLKMYTFAREFNPYDQDGMPILNKYFVHCRPRLDMFVSDYPLDDQFRFDIHHAQAVERCLPVPSQFL